MTKITTQATINSSMEKVWDTWNDPEKITQWNSASSDWHSPRAENDIQKGGTFNIRMEAKDGSQGFDFAGTYDEVIPHELIEYTMDDGRKVSVKFSQKDGQIHVEQTFDAETENSEEMQRAGWQSILDSFKKFVENE